MFDGALVSVEINVIADILFPPPATSGDTPAQVVAQLPALAPVNRPLVQVGPAPTKRHP